MIIQCCFICLVSVYLLYITADSEKNIIVCNSIFNAIDCESVRTHGHNLRLYKKRCNVVEFVVPVYLLYTTAV